ncbi:MAG: TlpA family protein disulfide reductase [Gammaproteobacteria bacterium]|nr:TlpA family protein disulfide reductase [Gammaproteobacteria bacterium]
MSVLQGGASPCKQGVVRAIRSGICYAFLFLTLNLVSQPAFALQAEQAKLIPHVDEEAKWSFQKYIYASTPKAFAIAPGGAWAWSEQEVNDEAAKRVAIANCSEQTQQPCIVYALNNKIIFDKKRWSTLWQLSDFEKSNSNSFGVSRASSFPDLIFKDSKGVKQKLSDSNGKIRLVHFWGSWCPPCIREMPDLVELQNSLRKNYGNKVKMILLQVREPYSQSLHWAKKYQFDKLPLYDSAPAGENNDILQTASGKKLYDRMIARVFPSSYILDQKGRVLFVHRGPIHNWNEYLPLLKGVAK